TGVQTCALPISPSAIQAAAGSACRSSGPKRLPGPDDGIDGHVLVGPAAHLYFPAFQLLIDREEVADGPQGVAGDVGETLDVLLVRVDGADRQDLDVLALVVGHVQRPDDPGGDDAGRLKASRPQHQDIEGVAVFGLRLRDVAIVGRVHYGARQDAIDPQDSSFFVDIVLDLAPFRQFDQCVHDHCDHLLANSAFWRAITFSHPAGHVLQPGPPGLRLDTASAPVIEC